jgi:hypothetical protein
MRKIAVILTILAATVVICGYRIVLLTIGSIVYVYLMPGLIAKSKQQVHGNWILIVCALFGWLIFPWLGALVYVYRTPSIAVEVLPRLSDRT